MIRASLSRAVCSVHDIRYLATDSASEMIELAQTATDTGRNCDAQRRKSVKMYRRRKTMLCAAWRQSAWRWLRRPYTFMYVHKVMCYTNVYIFCSQFLNRFCFLQHRVELYNAWDREITVPCNSRVGPLLAPTTSALAGLSFSLMLVIIANGRPS